MPSKSSFKRKKIGDPEDLAQQIPSPQNTTPQTVHFNAGQSFNPVSNILAPPGHQSFPLGHSLPFPSTSTDFHTPIPIPIPPPTAISSSMPSNSATFSQSIPNKFSKRHQTDSPSLKAVTTPSASTTSSLVTIPGSVKLEDGYNTNDGDNEMENESENADRDLDLLLPTSYIRLAFFTKNYFFFTNLCLNFFGFLSFIYYYDLNL
jgi:hypothetical protein